MSTAGLDLQVSSAGQINYNFVNIVFSEWNGRNGANGGEFRCVEKILMTSL